jgi:hypothetical protein
MRVHYTMLAGLIQRSGGSAFVIFDEETRRKSVSREGNRAYWVDDIILEQVRKGVVHSADSISSLAAKAGITVEPLKGTVTQYNQSCESGIDEHYLKQGTDAQFQNWPKQTNCYHFHCHSR